VWNVVSGCGDEQVSEGYQPLHWRKPRRIGVCFMGDLFHEAITDGELDEVFAIMALASKHTFLVLTKRPARMKRHLLDAKRHVADARHRIGRGLEVSLSRSQLLAVYGRSDTEWEALEDAWPLPNVLFGVTICTQAEADEKIPILLATPAAKRWVSISPMLEAISIPQPWLTGQLCKHEDCGSCVMRFAHCGPYHGPGDVASGWTDPLPHIDWVVLGGETGPGARPMQPEWALDVYRQCKEAGVPFWFKEASWARKGVLTLGGDDLDHIGEIREMVTTHELAEQKGG
jgi:protein gp37